MTERLTALDATFLELEQADDSAHMHIGGVMVFEPPRSGRPPSQQDLCGQLEARLDQLPRYRQRLSQPRTGGMAWPEWVHDPSFSITENIQRAALPSPGGERELAAWASNYYSQRLDRRRPLWEMVILEGLADGRWALVSKTHHCMVDGVGSVDVSHLMLDSQPDPDPDPGHEHAPRRRITGPGMRAERDPAAGSEPPEPPSPSQPLAALTLMARAAGSVVPSESIAHAAQMGVHGALHPREALHSARAAVEMIVREELRGAPHTSLNEPIGTRRRLEVMRMALADMREVGSALGGSVNDVALTVTTGGLRALLESRGEALPAQGLRAMVPMNLRSVSEHLALGNKISSLFIDLPVLEADAAQRLQETTQRSRALKSDGRQAAGTSAVLELAGLAPPVLHAGVARSLYAKRLFNLTVTNVPGPAHTLYCLGSRLTEIRPLVPLAAEHAVGVAILSYDGDACFGVVADPDSVPDLDVMLDAMRATAVELLDAARERAADALAGG